MANNQIGQRLVFENAKSFIQSQGYDASQAVLTQSYVRAEMALSTTVANYHVPVLVNDTVNGAAFNTEKRIQLQDIHVVSEIGVFVALPSSSTATNFALYSNPNKQIFTTSYSTLLSLYNGNLNIQVNNQNVLPAWDIWRHYSVPQTQNGVGVTAQTIFPVDQMEGSTTGFYPCEPNLLLNGAANIQANLTLPGAVTTIDANSRIVVIFRTILAQNVTSVK
jgi:hypothetical protein